MIYSDDAIVTAPCGGVGGCGSADRDGGLGTAVPGAAPLPSAETWHSLVQSLEATPDAPAAKVASVLSAALGAAKADDHWAGSGLMELLSRAAALAEAGFAASSRKSALGLLDFHNVVAKHRAKTSSAERKSDSDDTGSPANSTGGGGAAEVASSEFVGAKRQPQQQLQQQLQQQPHQQGSDTSELSEGDTAVLANGDLLPAQGPKSAADAADNTAADADGGSSKRRRTVSQSDAMSPPAPPSPRRPQAQAPLSTWTGAVKMKRGIDMCSMDMQVPADLVSEIPSELRVAELRARASVNPVGGLVCACSLRGASRTQLAQLRKMAALKLAAVAPLSDCAAIVSPYLTKDGSVKVVTFLAAL